MAQRASECSCPEAVDDTDTMCQEKIDNMYEKCDGQTRDGVPWDETKTRVKELAEQSACSGTFQRIAALWLCFASVAIVERWI